MQFVRLSDNLEFTIPLNRLSPADRELVMKFPKTGIMPSESSVAGRYIASREKQIARLTRDIEEIRLLLSKEGLTTSTIQAKNAEMNRKLEEIGKMTQQIREKKKPR